MSLTVRPIEREETQEFIRIASLALGMEPSNFDSVQPEWTQCAFDDGQLRTCYARFPFRMRFNGATIPVAAVTMVGTLPVARRQGNLRRIMETDFRFLHESGGPAIAALYASLAAIYQRFGYGIITTHHSYRVEPRYLQFAHPGVVRGRLVEVGRTEDGLLNDLLKRYREPRNADIHRSRGVWEFGAFAPPPPGHRLSELVYEEDGEPQGYIIYTSGPGNFPGPGPRLSLDIRDLVWLTPSAYRAFFEHLRPFDLVREITWNVVAPDDPLPHLLLEPRMLNDTSRDGILARVVDVERALPQRPYSAAGTLLFEVQDEMCPWNAGRWRMETDGITTMAVRTSDQPQLTMPVNTLAMLLFGQLSATEAARAGRLDVHDPVALAEWDAILRTHYRPFCADHF